MPTGSSPAPPARGLLEHTADLGLWVTADDPPQLFAAAVGALAELMVSGPRTGDISWLPLTLSASDLAELLVALLNEVVYLWDAESLLVVALELKELTPVRLDGRLGVLPRDPDTHQTAEPVKAVTYHRASVEPQGQGWRAQVILDV